MFNEKKITGYVWFTIENDDVALLEYMACLEDKYNLDPVTVLANEKYWKVVCRATHKTWASFMQHKDTKLTVSKSKVEGRFDYVVERL